MGIALAVAGWAALLIGWYQAGRQDLETGQIPYVLSGGFGGWALVVLGALAIFVDTVRQVEWRAHRQLGELQRTLDRVADSLDTSSPVVDREANGARSSRRAAATRRRRSRGPV